MLLTSACNQFRSRKAAVGSNRDKSVQTHNAVSEIVGYRRNLSDDVWGEDGKDS